MSSSRSPARWLGPLAILVALGAVFAIVSAATGGDDSGDSSRPASTEERSGGSGKQSTTKDKPASETTGSTTPKTTRKTYTVKAGDTLAGIAETTGVPIDELLELNPGVDSNSLSIGQELRLAR